MTRDERIIQLNDEFGCDQSWAPGEAERFAVVATASWPGDPDGDSEKVIKVWAERTDALLGAADMIVDGYAIDGIVDLDTGRAFGVSVTVACEPAASHALSLPWEA